ncbi:MAG TPA: zf-HC2 domain-containing protein [Bryobacteraceae bacterium]
MTCLQNDPQGAEILMDYCAGTLDAASTAQLEAHLQNCAVCNRAAEAQRKVWQALDEWKPEEVSLDFDQRLYARIAAEGRERWWRPSLRRPLVPAIAAAAMLIVALLPRAPQTRVPPPSPTPQVVVAGQRIDLRQVEQALDDMDMLTPVGQSSSSRL